MLTPYPSPLIPHPMTQTTPPPKPLPSALSCLTGSLIAGTMAIGTYTMTTSIATTFATKPMTQKTTMASNIATALRTLVLGSSTLATGVLTIAAIGLFALAIQVAFSKDRSRSVP